MANCTTFSFNWRVLIYKWAGSLRVAFHAYGISGNAAAQLLLLKRSMGIMTVAATDKSFVNLMVEGLRKCWLYIGMAGIAELRLRDLEHIGFALKRMHAVTTGAPHAGFSVGRAVKVRMRTSMARKAFFINNLRLSLAELKDLCRIAT